MSCKYHRGDSCAYPEWSAERCEWCHAEWTKITAPAIEIRTIRGFNRKTRAPSTTEQIVYLDGYGEMPANHFWRHALAALTLAERGMSARPTRTPRTAA